MSPEETIARLQMRIKELEQELDECIDVMTRAELKSTSGWVDPHGGRPPKKRRRKKP